MQTVVTAVDVQELANEAASALQSIAAQSAVGIATLTQETGATFGRVEQAYNAMDSKVESIGTTIGQLQEVQNQQRQSTEAARQTTSVLEQRLQESKTRRQEEAAQHKEEMRNQKRHIALLSGMINKEVKANEEATAALKKANEEQASTQQQVAALSAELKAALAQINDLSVNLASTRSLLDAVPQQKAAEGQAGTSQRQQTSIDQQPLQVLSTAAQKGKKTPSRTSSKKAPSVCPSLTMQSLQGSQAAGTDSSSSSQEETPKSWRFLRDRKGRSQDCGGSRGCGTDSPTAAPQIRFDIKPKDPPVFTGKTTDDVEVWV